MKKIVYHIEDKKNICGTVSDNCIKLQYNKTLKQIQKIINENTRHIRLCKRCEKIMEKRDEI